MHYIKDLAGTAYRADLFDYFEKHGDATVGHFRSSDGGWHTATFDCLFEVPYAPAAVVPSQPGFYVIEPFWDEHCKKVEGFVSDPVVAWHFDGKKVQPIALGYGLSDRPVRRPDGEIECQWDRFSEAAYVKLLNREKAQARS